MKQIPAFKYFNDTTFNIINSNFLPNGLWMMKKDGTVFYIDDCLHENILHHFSFQPKGDAFYF
jgi:hypothetical protein